MVIYWHKRDLRLLDNPALVLSLKLCHENNIGFLPILGLETDLITNLETSYEFSDFYQFGFVSATLPLIQNYQHFGIEPGLFCEPFLEFLNKINSKEPVKYLVSHQEHGTNGTFSRDKLVQNYCNKNGIIWYQIPPSGVVRKLENRDIRDKIVKTYLNSPILAIPDFSGIKQTIKIDNQEIIDKFVVLKSNLYCKYDLESTSEKSAQTCLQTFTNQRASNYRGGISSPNKALIFGSRLSQFLAFGTLSLRYVTQYFWKKIKETQDRKIKAGILGAMQRLHWREHFIQRLETSPDMPDSSIHSDFNTIEYSNQYFEEFKAGKTGEPLIDACIRCLNATGFINFRMRAMLVSYGVFGLDLDWRILGRFLATRFLDYEPGIHWSQIQMQAGITGINTIRVYSPKKQLLDQDPECVFVKKWIPEIAHLSCEEILNYTENSLYTLSNGLYPNPVVDFNQTSKINKSKTYNIRSSSTKESNQKVFIKHGSRKIRPKKTPKPQNVAQNEIDF